MSKTHEKLEIRQEPLAVTECSSADDEHRCGYSWWRPAFVQRFARPSAFLLVMCLFVGSDGLNVGIITGTITSIEARFQFTLTELGSMQTSLCVGGIVGLVVSSYLGARPGSSKPRLLCICSVLCGLGMAAQSLPQFLQGPYVPASFSSYGPEDTPNATALTCTASRAECGGDASVHGVPFNRVAYWVFVAASVLQGMAVFGVYPLGVAYISDSTSQGTTSLYIGVINAVLGLGPVLGVMMAAAFLGIWVDYYRVDGASEFGLSPGDPEWIGAWWLGYIIFGVLFGLSAFLFLLFPRQLSSSDRPASHEEAERMKVAEMADGDGEIIGGNRDLRFVQSKAFLLAVWRTLQNPYCSLTCLSQSTFYFIMYGYGIFIPKYLEVQFGYEKQVADLITGVLLAPAYAFGELLAGVLVKKLDLKIRGIIRLTCAMLTACVVGMVLLMVIGCENDKVVGVFTSHDGLSSQAGVGMEAPCNQNCTCSLAVYAPVCSEEGLTYFSPCHAGCQQTSANHSFLECACPMSRLTNTSTTDGMKSFSVVEGACGTQCRTAIPFLIVLTAIFVLATFSDLLRLTIIVRSATSNNRLVALSLAYLTQIIGVVPAGLIFGSVIDSTCSVWQQTCQGQGACLLYDIHAYRLAYTGLALGVAVFSAGVMFIVLFWPKGKFTALVEGDTAEDKTTEITS